jgi:hypothetical protein
LPHGQHMRPADRAALLISIIAIAMALAIGKVTLDLSRAKGSMSAYGTAADPAPRQCWPTMASLALLEASQLDETHLSAGSVSVSSVSVSASLPDPNPLRVQRVRTETIPVDRSPPRQECRPRSYWSVKYGECRLKRYGQGGGESPHFAAPRRICRRQGLFGPLECVDE